MRRRRTSRRFAGAGARSSRCRLRTFLCGRREAAPPVRPGRVMPCENVSHMMQRARRGGYAVGYFESWNLESLQGVVDAAEKTRSPVILGFNGHFLSRSDRIVEERLELYASMGRAACASADV